MRVLNVGGASKDIPLPARYRGWQHDLLDIAPGPGVDHVVDARSMCSSMSPCVYDAVFCSHNLEHYYAHELDLVLMGIRFVLKPGGSVHVVVPDVWQLLVKMLDEGIDLDEVLYESTAGPVTPHDVLYGFGEEVAGGNPFYAHKTGFTRVRLQQVLEKAGFEDVKVVADHAVIELEGTGHT